MRKLTSAVSMLLAVCASTACGDDDDRAGAGSSCALASQCYTSLREPVRGAPVCLDRVEGGYCTHECTTDADCCAVAGECPGGRAQVCGPFESTGKRLCFLSCEGQDDAYCARYAFAGFGCRSTGGGSANRKVCVP